MNLLEKRAMDGAYPIPNAGRTDPPRESGLTMVIDMGSGIVATRDLLDYAGRYIDILKISSGTAAIYPERVLVEKLELCRTYGIETKTGGSHFEVAYWKQAVEAFFRKALTLGFSAVEIADGHLPLSETARMDSIRRAKDMGLKVATEVGKKLPSENIKAPGIVEMIQKDLEAGSDYIIIEGKASGMDVGIFDESGNINEEELEEIVSGVDDMNRIIWEAPLRPQEQALILRFGPNVNLGNIFPQEVYPLELMRNSLMLMPLIEAYRKDIETGGKNR